MEFMERRNKILPVQFWLTVESFKDTLEDIDVEVGLDAEWEDARLGETEEVTGTAREDMRGVWEVYFEEGGGLFGEEEIDERWGEDIRRFVNGTGSKGLARARRR